MFDLVFVIVVVIIDNDSDCLSSASAAATGLGRRRGDVRTWVRLQSCRRLKEGLTTYSC